MASLTRGWIMASLWAEDLARRAFADQDGMETTEIALALAILGIAAIAAFKGLGSVVVSKFQSLAGTLAGA